MSDYNIAKLLDLYKKSKFSKIVKNSNTFIKKYPNYPDVETILGVAEAESGNLRKAKEHFKNVTNLTPTSHQAWFNLGFTEQKLLHINLAEKAYLKAIEIRPNYPEAIMGYVNIMIMKGEFDKSKSLLSKLLKQHPRHAEAHQQFSRINKYKKDDEHINKMQIILKMPNLSVKETVLINHGLGKARSDLKEYSLAFRHWQIGNEAFKKNINYDFEEDRSLFNYLHRCADYFSSIKPNSIDTKTLIRRPIFIIGMPRSGTSLLEQILSGHSKIYGAGELDTLGFAIQKNILSKPQFSQIKFNNLTLRKIRDFYINDINALPTECELVTDKMPLNFKWISFIRAIFPNAPILHLKRHPMAVCFSNFRYFFQSKGMRYSNCLLDIGRYYMAYDKLMRRFILDHGDAIKTIDYEALTQDPKLQITNLLASFNLEWQEACLKIEDNKRAVKTVSNIQIRNSIYTNSSEEWKHYKEELAPLKDMLMPILERDGWV